MVLHGRPRIACLRPLLLLGLLLWVYLPSAAADSVVGVKSSSHTPVVNLTALSDGSIGNLPAQMLLYQAVLIEMNHTGATLSSTPKGIKQEVDASENGIVKQQKDAREGANESKNETEDKKTRDKDNGAVVGATIGGALAAGLADADNPATALCKALAVGAGSAMGTKTGQLIGGVYPPPEEKKKAGSVYTNSTSSSTMSAKPSQSSAPNHLGPGMVGPGLGNFVGTGVSAGLGKGICDGLFGDAGKWLSKIAESILPPDVYDAGRIAMKEALANGRTQILTRAMENAGVPVHRASQLVSELEHGLQRLQDFGLDGVAEDLQRDLLNGASQIADVIVKVLRSHQLFKQWVNLEQYPASHHRPPH